MGQVSESIMHRRNLGLLFLLLKVSESLLVLLTKKTVTELMNPTNSVALGHGRQQVGFGLKVQDSLFDNG